MASCLQSQENPQLPAVGYYRYCDGAAVATVGSGSDPPEQNYLMTHSCTNFRGTNKVKSQGTLHRLPPRRQALYRAKVSPI